MIASLEPYPRMKDSGIPWLGDVPKHWEIQRAKNIFGCVDIRSQTGKEELLTVSSDHGIVLRRSTSVTMFKAESYVGYKLCWPNDLVINSLWAWARGLGVSQYHGIISTAYGVYRPGETIHPKFVHELVRSVPFNWELRTRSKGVWTSRLQLTDDSFLGIPFPLPALPEQAAIVKFIGHYDRKIQRYIRAKQRLIKLLEEQITARAGEAMRNAACTTERLADVAIEYLRPVEREDDERYVALGLYNRGRGIFHKSPTLGAELGDSTFSWVEPDDLVISGQFAWEGAVALASSAENQTIVSHRYYLLRGIDGRSTTPYLLALLRSDFGAMLLDQHSRGAAGRNRPLNLRTLLKEPIPVPPFQVQLDLDELIQASTPLRVQAALAVALCREYRTRLIADVVTGKLDVREAAAKLPDKTEDLEPLETADELIDSDDPTENENLAEALPEEVEA